MRGPGAQGIAGTGGSVAAGVADAAAKNPDAAWSNDPLAQAQFGTIRALLLKVAAVVRVSVRRVWVTLSSVFPFQELFAQSLARLGAEEPG